MNNYIAISTLEKLYHLPNPKEGQMYYCNENGKFYHFNEEWKEINFESKGLEMNLYELNKTIINQLPEMNMAEISDKMELIETYYDRTSANHHMLLCKEYNYYTIFENDTMISLPTFSGALCSVITELGKVYSMDLKEGGAMEIWIKPEGEELPMAFYLFPYDVGVVYYG